MSCDGITGKVEALPRPAANGTAAAAGASRPSMYGDRRLRLNPNTDHKPDKYDDVQADYDPCIFSSLERHLPPSMLEAPRDDKIQFMKDILSKYLPSGERFRKQKHTEYRRMISHYEPLHKEIYNLHPSAFFVPSFVKAISDNNEESFRKIISEPYPGIFTFEMLQPSFCQLLLSEVENFEKWVRAMKLKVMQPSTMNKHGAVLDDFGFEQMLDQLMGQFISPITKVFFPEVGGSSLDTHHGFVVEYGDDKDLELGLHVDDSEVTLNVCLGNQFSGGDLFFRGIRCERHVNIDAHPEEIFDYSHIPGQAVLHHGRHRHGARATTSGYRINLLMWCRSSVFREMKTYQSDFSSWCGECQFEKKERLRLSIAATKLEFLRRKGDSKAKV